MLWLSPYKSQHQDLQTPVGLSVTTTSLAQCVECTEENEIRSKIKM